MAWQQTIGLLTNELSIDLGSSRTRIWMRGRGLTIDEPSLLVYSNPSKPSWSHDKLIVCVALISAGP